MTATTPFPRSSPVSRAVVVLALALAFLAAHTAADSARAEASELVACPVLLSADSRLVFEQWAPPGGHCDKAVQTRVTDRFLGYTCTERTVGTAVCRAYMPGPGSRAFDTSKHYRCLDIAIMPTDEGAYVVGLREWAAPQPKQCEFDPNLSIIVSELNFANRQICIAGLCIAPKLLSVVGKSRLRKLTGQAFRELGLAFDEDQADAGGLVRPTLQGSR